MIGLGSVTAIAMEPLSFGNFILVKVGALDMNVCPGFEGALTHGQRSSKLSIKAAFAKDNFLKAPPHLHRRRHSYFVPIGSSHGRELSW